MRPTYTLTDKRRWFEILAVILTAILKYIVVDWLGFRLFFIVTASLFWFLYILSRYKKEEDILLRWGFQNTGFKKTFIFCMPFILIVMLGIIGYSIFFGKGISVLNFLSVFGLYPFWGGIQQFLVAGLVAGNLRSLPFENLNDNQIILLVSSLFSLAHSPDIYLMAFTLTMELFFLSAYFRWRNLWALGILHGWLGGMFLYFVMHRDLWTELWILF